MNLVDKINELFDKPKEIDYYAIFSQLNMLLRSGSDMPKATADIADFQDKKVLGTAQQALRSNADNLLRKAGNIYAYVMQPAKYGYTVTYMQCRKN